MTTRIPATISALILSACASTGGSEAEVSYSGFDRAKVVSIAPHGFGSFDSPIALGASWTSATPGAAVVTICVYRAVSIVGAQVRVGGERLELTKADTVTSRHLMTSGMVESCQDFITTIGVVHQIATAADAWVRVHTATGIDEGAVIDHGDDSRAYHALRRFLVAVRGK